jgi:undecaprenyl diphosphate synthase
MNEVPQHVSIIMDGNGRWAKARGRERVYGHVAGVESVRACTEAAVEAGVKYLSLYAFSEENWNRPEAEVNRLMELMMEAIRNEVKTLMDNGVRFVVLGNRARLSGTLNAAIDELMEKTASCSRMTLIVFLSYSGQWDILQAAKKAAAELGAEEMQKLAPADFSRYLVTAGIPDPDLLIRTSGELRISNYLLWQCAYTEFYFSDVLWPDFRKPEFREALRAYAQRDRRYGKVK